MFLPEPRLPKNNRKKTTVEVLGLKHDRIPRRQAERAIRMSCAFGGAKCTATKASAEAIYLSAALKISEGARSIMGAADDRNSNGKPPLKLSSSRSRWDTSTTRTSFGMSSSPSSASPTRPPRPPSPQPHAGGGHRRDHHVDRRPAARRRVRIPGRGVEARHRPNGRVLRFPDRLHERAHLGGLRRRIPERRCIKKSGNHARTVLEKSAARNGATLCFFSLGRM